MGDIANNGLKNTTRQLMEAIRTSNTSEDTLRCLWVLDSLLLMSVATCPTEWVALLHLTDEVFSAWKGRMDEMQINIVVQATACCLQVSARAKYMQEVRNVMRTFMQKSLYAANIELRRLLNASLSDTNLNKMKRQSQNVLSKNLRCLHPHVFL